MKYLSTRNNKLSLSASQAIIKGISDDGGLFVPEYIPKININNILSYSYKEVAFEVMSKFFTDFSEEALKECIEKAYDSKFDNKEIAPVVKVEDNYVVELFHGKTLAFKDMALSILPYLLKEALKINNIKEELVILTATSGDTGKAALEGFKDVEGIKIIVFFPEEGVSNIQKLQMKSQEGENTYVISINGNFDDAQTGVKNIFNNKDVKDKLLENNYRLSSANSINIGRLVPQIVYYINSYIKLINDKEIKENEKINIVVPTGNFGNILAAYYAREMGLPVNKLICASNENNVLTDFFKTGEYNKQRQLKLTTSPSMDILVSSNLERLLYHINYKEDKIKEKMELLEKVGKYKINKSDLQDFYAGYVSDKEVEETIKEVFNKTSYLMDTHTAVAYKISKKYKEETKDTSKNIIASTASAYKFGEAVARSLELDINNKSDFEIINQISEKSKLDIPKELDKLRNKNIIHKDNCDKEKMLEYIYKFLKVGDLLD